MTLFYCIFYCIFCRFYSAGIWHNVVFALLSLVVLYSLPTLLTATLYDRGAGVLVADITPSTKSFFRVGDLITHIDGCRIRSPIAVQHSYDTGRCYRDSVDGVSSSDHYVDGVSSSVDGVSSSDHYGTYIYYNRIYLWSMLYLEYFYCANTHRLVYNICLRVCAHVYAYFQLSSSLIYPYHPNCRATCSTCTTLSR